MGGGGLHSEAMACSPSKRTSRVFMGRRSRQRGRGGVPAARRRICDTCR